LLVTMALLAAMTSRALTSSTGKNAISELRSSHA